MNRYARKAASALEIASFALRNPEAVRAALAWPKFSLTSYAMVSRLKAQGLSPETILDVGANVGQFAVAAAKGWPKSRVHSFEAVPECAAELRKNTAKLANTRVYPFALGDSEGEIEIHVNAHSHSSSVLPLASAHLDAFPEATEARTTRVRVETLDAVFSGADLPGPVLLKLDVQGYEPEVLRGGAKTLRRVDYVVLEASFRPMYRGEKLFGEVDLLMKDLNFRFERPVGWLQSPKTGEMLQMDALYVREGP